jgi:DNA uptake protein ComE-like DNA-binding protein
MSHIVHLAETRRVCVISIFRSDSMGTALITCHRLPDTRRTSTTIDSSNTINLNRASEDEFLFLPGITRQIARNILDYRRKYNGIERIDELLEVSGVTAEIFRRIRSDISVDAPSKGRAPLASRLINLNWASHDELCSIVGLTPVLATRIIQRRQRKGLFRFVEDLLEVKGIDYVILASVRPRVTVDQARIRRSLMNDLDPTTSLASLLLETLPVELQTIVLSSPPRRAALVRATRDKRGLIASWNLQAFTLQKANNPGVREVICRVILENK